MTKAFPQSTSRLENIVRYKLNPQITNKIGTMINQAVNPIMLAATPIKRDSGIRIIVNTEIFNSFLMTLI